MTTNFARSRGRPRRFNPEHGVVVAQKLFLSRGFDAVGVADLTKAMGINPPSFYAAYGSKAELFALALERYTQADGVPLDEILQAGKPPVEALSCLLKDAAKRYTANAGRGCLAIEGARCNDVNASEAARRLTSAARDRIYRFLRETHPNEAHMIADYTIMVMSGLSAMAREGFTSKQVLQTAKIAATAYHGNLN